MDPGPVLKILRAEIKERPSRVLMAVEDALTMCERAACEIVKEAITATRADANLVGEIVFTALRQAPGMAATIVECAVSCEPAAIAEIRLAMQRALGSQAAAGEISEGSGKAAPEESIAGETTGKGVAGSGKGSVRSEPEPPEIEESFDVSRVGIGGIYLLMPSRAFYFPCEPNDPCCSDDLSNACLRP